MTGRRRDRTAHSARRGGYTLIEVTVVLWALAVALALGATLLLAVLRASQVGAGTLRELARRTELADQFRADVARAATTPDRFGELTAGPTCLILRTTDGKVVAYRWHEGDLERSASSFGKAVWSRFPIGRETTTAAFMAFDFPQGRMRKLAKKASTASLRFSKSSFGARAISR